MIWRVVTHAAYYDIDMRAGTLTRERLEGTVGGYLQARMPNDGQPRELVKIAQCEIGQPLVCIVRRDGFELPTTSTPVREILQV